MGIPINQDMGGYGAVKGSLVYATRMPVRAMGHGADAPPPTNNGATSTAIAMQKRNILNIGTQPSPAKT